ncbi:MAG TPA: hypothetical protein VM553_09070 [Dongiaceae bacterium]|nr:hypothetical protein [Dongiaceae bacterium]
MLSADDEPLREFQYFDEDGVFIGKSQGTAPDEALFNQAHYVFDDHNDVVKNLDLLAILRRRLLNLRRELVNVPVQQMERIMEINRQILTLEQHIVDIQNQGWKRAG